VVSPKVQLKLNGPTPPVVVAANVTSEEVVGDAGVNVNSTAESAGATVMLWLDVALTPLTSVAFTLTVKDPDEV
jgi:hypothetical protein